MAELSINFWWIFMVFVLLISYWYLTIPKNLPPGPRGYPIIGSLLSVGKLPHLGFIRLGKKYGNVMHVYLGSKLAIVLNDFEAMKEAYVKQGKTFQGRYEDEQFNEFEGSTLGVAFSNGEIWRQHRRFILSNLKNNGVGKLSLEPLILNEIQQFLSLLKTKTGHEFNVKIALHSSMSNNILQLLTGQRYDYDHHLFNAAIEALEKYAKFAQSFAILTFFPWIKRIPGVGTLTNIEYRRQVMIKMYGNIKVMVKSTLNQSEKFQDDIYAKAYMKERNSRLLHNKNEQIFTENGLFINIRDLFMGGTETASTTLNWLMLYMTFYPEVQQKIREEIDRVIGGDREPSYNDRFNTPYTEATIMEVLRMVTITAFGLPHQNLHKTTLFGFDIPKSTMILANIYAVHHDPKLWGDPDNFRPERFIGDEKQLVKPEYYIPFGIGKRACVGEPLARMELYLYFVSLIQHFEVIPANGLKQSLESIDSVLRQPACNIVCLKQRLV